MVSRASRSSRVAEHICPRVLHYPSVISYQSLYTDPQTVEELRAVYQHMQYQAYNILAAMFLLIFGITMYLSRREAPIYLVDFSVFVPEGDELKITREKFKRISRVSFKNRERSLVFYALTLTPSIFTLTARSLRMHHLYHFPMFRKAAGSLTMPLDFRSGCLPAMALVNIHTSLLLLYRLLLRKVVLLDLLSWT